MKTNFKQRLAEAGFTGTTEDFYSRMGELFEAHRSKYETDEQLKRDPSDALAFCNLVREILRLPNLDSKLILGGLENHRKGKRKSVSARKAKIRSV